MGVRSLGTMGLVALMAVLIAVPSAGAHSKLVRAVPAAGATVKVPPKVVRAWFPEELDPRRSALSVWDAKGRRVDDGKGGVDLNDLDRASMVVRLRPIGPGTYTVKWRAVSADDQNVAQGSYTFKLIRP